jgi:hypothetical protein
LIGLPYEEGGGGGGGAAEAEEINKYTGRN